MREGRTPSVEAARTAAALANEELAGARLSARTRALVLPIIAVWFSIEYPASMLLVFYPSLVAFGLLGYAPLWLRRAGVCGGWVRYLFPFLDVTLLTLVVFVPATGTAGYLLPTLRLRLGNELYLFFFIATAVFSYSPAVVLWTGVCAAAAWSAATAWVASLPTRSTSPAAWSGSRATSAPRWW